MYGLWPGLIVSPVSILRAMEMRQNIDGALLRLECAKWLHQFDRDAIGAETCLHSEGKGIKHLVILLGLPSLCLELTPTEKIVDYDKGTKMHNDADWDDLEEDDDDEMQTKTKRDRALSLQKDFLQLDPSNESKKQKFLFELILNLHTESRHESKKLKALSSHCSTLEVEKSDSLTEEKLLTTSANTTDDFQIEGASGEVAQNQNYSRRKLALRGGIAGDNADGDNEKIPFAVSSKRRCNTDNNKISQEINLGVDDDVGNSGAAHATVNDASKVQDCDDFQRHTKKIKDVLTTVLGDLKQEIDTLTKNVREEQDKRKADYDAFEGEKRALEAKNKALIKELESCRKERDADRLVFKEENAKAQAFLESAKRKNDDLAKKIDIVKSVVL